MPSSLAPVAPQPLPRSREVLTLLLEQVQEFVTVADGFLQRQRYRGRTIQHVLGDPDVAAKVRHPIILAARDESRKHAAQGLPNIRALVPHIDESRFQSLLEAREAAMKALQGIASPADNLPEWLESLEAVIDLEEQTLNNFSMLQSRIAAALDESADTGADAARKLFRVLPKNPLILELFQKILDNRDNSMSQLDIAKEFADQRGGDPDVLLRGVRRLRNRLKQA